MSSDTDSLSPQCFNPECDKQFDSVNDMLADTDAKTKFVSFEPLIGADAEGDTGDSAEVGV